MKCERCGDHEAHERTCPGDHRLHHHGAVHTTDHELQLVCDYCAEEIDAGWKLGKAMNVKLTNDGSYVGHDVT